MKIAVGSDERTHLTDILTEELKKQGHKLILFGPLAEHDPDVDWPLTSSKVAQAVASGEADEGIVCCWTGTGGTYLEPCQRACAQPESNFGTHR